MTAYLITDEQVRRVLRLADLCADNADAGPLPSALDPREQLSMLLANLPRIEDGHLTITAEELEAAMDAIFCTPGVSATADLNVHGPGVCLNDIYREATTAGLRAVGITVQEADQ